MKNPSYAMHLLRNLLLLILTLCSTNLFSANRYEDDYTNYHSHNIVFEETSSTPATTNTNSSPSSYPDNSATPAHNKFVFREYDFSNKNNPYAPHEETAAPTTTTTCSVLPEDACSKSVTKIVYVPYPVNANCPCPPPPCAPCPGICNGPCDSPRVIYVSKPASSCGSCFFGLSLPPLPSFPCIKFFPDFCSWDTPFCSKYSQVYFGLDTFSTKIHVSRRSRGVNDYFGTRRFEREYKNTMVGTVLGYTYREPCGIYFNAEFDWLTGELNRNNHRPSRYAHYYLGQGRVGYNFIACDCLLATPYAGIGYDYVDNHINHTNLSMRYRNYYAILGGRVDYLMYEDFSIGLDGQWQLQLDSSVRLSSYPNLRFKLEHKNGYELQLPLCYRLCGDQLVLTISPYTRRYKDGRSKSTRFSDDTRIRVPEQIHQNWGGKINVGYLF